MITLMWLLIKECVTTQQLIIELKLNILILLLIMRRKFIGS